ncbi:MAG: DapH/DapD/GlmU-related protein [Legionella sp.]|nr:DapH/DapD/GlmU-related protein [Legionella sp.]
MSIYSKKLITIFSWFFGKIKGALGRYRMRSLIKNVGNSSRCPLSVELKCPENISIGHHVSIGPYSTIGAFEQVILEDYVRISKGVIIETAGLNLKSGLPYKHKGKPILIKKGAWLGARCVVLGGVTIGQGAIIGAGAIISKDIPDFAIVVSQPTRIIGDTRD